MLACLITVERAAAADGPDVGALIVPGACFVHSVSEKARTIDRIELQLMQVIGKDRSPIGGNPCSAWHPTEDGDDAMPSGLSAPCVGVGRKLSCTLSCGDTDKHGGLGRFRTEPAGVDRLRLVIETPLVLGLAAQPTKSRSP